jgi:hypothetical protein
MDNKFVKYKQYIVQVKKQDNSIINFFCSSEFWKELCCYENTRDRNKILALFYFKGEKQTP